MTNSWLDLAITEELRTLAGAFVFENEVVRAQAALMAKLLDKAYESWDGNGEFGDYASKVLFILSQSAELREKMGLNTPQPG